MRKRSTESEKLPKVTVWTPWGAQNAPKAGSRIERLRIVMRKLAEKRAAEERRADPVPRLYS